MFAVMMMAHVNPFESVWLAWALSTVLVWLMLSQLDRVSMTRFQRIVTYSFAIVIVFWPCEEWYPWWVCQLIP